MIPDMVTVVLILGMTYALMSEGLWGACLMFFNALFAAMITLNFYEPLAQVIGTNMEFLSGYADALCILLIFTASLLIMRLLTEYLAPAMVRFPMPLYHVGRVIFGLGGAAITAGMIWLALDASPGQGKVLGSYDYQHRPFFGVRLDTELLAFFQYSTGQIFTRQGGTPDPYTMYGTSRVFDPKSNWLLRTQLARPHSPAPIFEESKADAAAAKEGAPAAAPQ
jgi:uncharacterized membrane protein required for colicin V production